MNSEEKRMPIRVKTSHGKYRILTFFKKEPSIGITCVSALVVIVSFIVNIAIYLWEVAYLSYWKVDASYAFVSSPNQFYRVCGTVLHSIIITIVLSIVNGAYEAYLPAKKLIIARRSRLRSANKKIRETEKRLRQIKRNHKKQTPEMRTELRSLEKENCANKIDLNEIRKFQNDINREMVKDLIVHLILAWVLLWIGASLFFVLSGNSKNAIGLGLVYALILVVLFYCIAAFSHRKSLNRRQLRNADSDRVDEYMQEWADSEKKYPIEWDWRHYFNDKNIISTLLASTVYIAMMLCFFSRFGYLEAKNEDTFAVSYHDNMAYISIYTTDEVVVLERCTIISVGDELVVEIDTQKQRIIPMNDIEYEIINFNEVRIKTSEK